MGCKTCCSYDIHLIVVTPAKGNASTKFKFDRQYTWNDQCNVRCDPRGRHYISTLVSTSHHISPLVTRSHLCVSPCTTTHGNTTTRRNGRRLVPARTSVWTSHWLVALHTFNRKTLSLAYSYFSFETFAPGLPGSTCIYLHFRDTANFSKKSRAMQYSLATVNLTRSISSRGCGLLLRAETPARRLQDTFSCLVNNRRPVSPADSSKNAAPKKKKHVAAFLREQERHQLL